MGENASLSSPLDQALAQEDASRAHRGASPESATPRIPSKQLFGSGRRLIIEHEGREYSLLITRQGKLVLNRCG